MRRQRLARGFTLIEMMAVLVLFGLLTAVVLPNFQRWFDSTQQRVAAGELAIRVQKLLARSALLGQSLELNAVSARLPLSDGDPALPLPDGWGVAEGSTIAIRASGLCRGAALELESSSQRMVVDIAANTCAVSVRSLPPLQP